MTISRSQHNNHQPQGAQPPEEEKTGIVEKMKGQMKGIGKSVSKWAGDDKAKWAILGLGVMILALTILTFMSTGLGVLSMLWPLAVGVAVWGAAFLAIHKFWPEEVHHRFVPNRSTMKKVMYVFLALGLGAFVGYTAFTVVSANLFLPSTFIWNNWMSTTMFTAAFWAGACFTLRAIIPEEYHGTLNKIMLLGTVAFLGYASIYLIFHMGAMGMAGNFSIGVAFVHGLTNGYTVYGLFVGLGAMGVAGAMPLLLKKKVRVISSSHRSNPRGMQVKDRIRSEERGRPARNQAASARIADQQINRDRFANRLKHFFYAGSRSYEGDGKEGYAFQEMINYFARGKVASGMDEDHLIQWLFPTDLGSNPNAPVLTNDQIRDFQQDPVVQEKMERAFNAMMSYYGLNYSRINQNVVPAANWDEQKSLLLGMVPIGETNQEFLRISRILRSLSLMGHYDRSNAFIDFLTDLQEGEGNLAIDSETMRHWKANWCLRGR